MLRYNLALAFLALAIALSLVVVRSRIGHVLVAIRENENRTAMLGYDVARYKLIAFVLSGTLRGLRGRGLCADVRLCGLDARLDPVFDPSAAVDAAGRCGDRAGAVLGTALMFLLVDFASGFTIGQPAVVGVVLIVLVLFFPKGILGTLRQRLLPWLP